MGQLFPDERKLTGAEIVSALVLFGAGVMFGAAVVSLVWWLS